MKKSPGSALRHYLLAWLIVVMLCPLVALAQKVKVGDPAPDFSVPSLDGQTTLRLSDFRGRRVLIFAWASW